MIEPKKNKKILKRGIAVIITISLIGFFFAVWIVYLYPIMEDSLKVWQLFLILYALVISFWLVLFIGLFGFNKRAIKSGIILFIISSIIFMVCYPSVNMDGSLDFSSKGTIDFTIGYYLNCFGIHGFIVFFLTYCIFPIIILFIFMLILRPKTFIRTIKSTV